ncbi:hypothetical protein EOPP23_05660 [Endozoicomonas sp. OPT23]|uniref:hypothetical protein n=1 Tax=Endozoicomonas sp. OPT23 TaxID=2072845 RepID=UPI00129B3769|nr:hypothetical protein [Endozoicomonas sp. OPT23]MRI32471.1 hypothetical protein [Endozoicomonas sp. OPT23]
MLYLAKKITQIFSVLALTASVNADLVLPFEPDIRDSGVEQIDLQIYVTRSTLAEPLGTDFKLSISCKSHVLVDIFHQYGKVTFERSFLCPAQNTEYPGVCHALVTTKELTESLNSPECEALVETEAEAYYFSEKAYRESVNEGINFPLNFPNIGGFDFISLSLDKGEIITPDGQADEGRKQ